MKHTILRGKSVVDGAGVRLRRVFARDQAERTDPFLLFDHFGSADPEDYIKGFPWHPHRGIETVTYMLGGTVEHKDNLGNAGTIGPGDIQWMTAGRGVIHQEMPVASREKMHGVQLWVNLPAEHKMMEPRYRGILAREIPAVEVPGGEVRVIAGRFDGITGPVRELMVEVEYLDIRLKKGAAFSREVRDGFSSFGYLIEGKGAFDGAKLETGGLILFEEAGRVAVEATEDIRTILVSGRRLKEPIAWGGPIVMNTQAELARAFRELDEGTFIRTG